MYGWPPSWWAAVHGVTKSLARLSNFTFTFHFHALEKEMATHYSVLAWRIPGTGESGGLLSMGSHRVGHNWSDLAAAATEPLHSSPEAITTLLIGYTPIQNVFGVRTIKNIKGLIVGLWPKTIWGYSRYERVSGSTCGSLGCCEDHSWPAVGMHGCETGIYQVVWGHPEERLSFGPLLAHW